jgi:hypothetical protein
MEAGNRYPENQRLPNPVQDQRYIQMEDQDGIGKEEAHHDQKPEAGQKISDTGTRLQDHLKSELRRCME